MNDTSTGRFTIRDLKTGRVFTVEVIHGRNDRADGDWTNGGIDRVKHRGSISAEESIITAENGFTNITMTRNPMDEVMRLLGR